VNVSPEPFSNIGLSLFEDGLVVGLVLLAVEYPLAALVVVVVLLVLGVWLVVTLWRAIGRVASRISARFPASG